MNVFFRCDSSINIGSGHVMRCLTLAGYLREKGVGVKFICRDFPGCIIDYIEEKGYPVYRLPNEEKYLYTENIDCQDRLGAILEEDARQTADILKRAGNADWLVIDHYSLDQKWESHVNRYTQKIMVIDDLANRPHQCDILLDQNYYHNLKTRYNDLVPVQCLKFLGPEFTLLRPDFYELRNTFIKHDGKVSRILVFFGGSDPTNETEKAINAILRLNIKNINTDVVVGGGNPRKEEIRKLCSSLNNFNFHCQVDNMAEIMAKANLSVGAGGSAMWERCFLGLPALVIVTADNQYEISKAVADRGAIRFLGWHYEVDIDSLELAISKAVSNPEAVRSMGENSLRLMGAAESDGKGRVIMALLEGSHV